MLNEGFRSEASCIQTIKFKIQVSSFCKAKIANDKYPKVSVMLNEGFRSEASCIQTIKFKIQVPSFRKASIQDDSRFCHLQQVSRNTGWLS